MTDTQGSMQPSDFVHLHNHTHHSLLDGLTKVPELVKRVKDTGMHAVAMTDHGTMAGTIEFYKECQAQGIKPVIGIETYVATRKHTDKDPAYDKNRYHLILLAMNQTGYQNLMLLSTTANLDGYYYKPRIDHDLLEQHNEGLIALSACLGGEVSDKLKDDDYEGGKKVAAWYQSVFGDRYYLEIQDHVESDLQMRINKYLFQIGKELGIECVVTSDAHYVLPEDQEAHEILLCVGTGAYLSDEKRMSLRDWHLHVTDPADVIKRWGDEHPEIIKNTKKIADRCQVDFEFGKILIPTFETPEGHDEKSYLHELVWQGLAWRYGGVEKTDTPKLTIEQARKKLSKEIIDRAEYELGVIDNMGFNGYFLIVQDFINWGKNEGIVFGPGRGSAAGSIIAYSIAITELDPIYYDLLFERFLNPDRISMPDIDIDIQDTRRDEVIQYCVRKYGEKRVSNIGTFGTMAARGSVRDVARVLEVPYAEADRIAKLIPPPVQGRHIPISKSIVTDPDLKAEYESNPTAKRVIDFAARVEGTIRSHGVHAAGVVIAPDDVVKFAPLEMAQKGVVATQFPMGPVEDLGLLKMDFLGLSNLSIINNALRIIRKAYGEKIDINKIPLDDKKTYELFQRGDTTGVFQLESAGMKRYLKILKPSVFDDIIAMVALYRPGPMQFIDSFIRRKHGEEEITYLHEGLKGSLESTYGILIYQEQFMQISKDWSGFTGGQADTLRKAVGKKKIDLMKKVKPEFVEGAMKVSGASQAIAEKFWDQLEEFANYSFNKSHAACYGLIAYWTAYLKAHYPDAFMAAVMTSDQDDTDRLAIEISECRHSGIEVLPPDVNQSYSEFAVVPGENKIRFGMAGVKGVGSGAVEEVIRARDADGKFKSIGDFAQRVSTNKFNRKAWESLIKAGGFDAYGERSDLLYNLDDIVAYAQRIQKERNSNQADLFGGLDEVVAIPDITLTPAPTKYTDREQLMWERELLGLYLSAHPLDNYQAFFAEQTVGADALSPKIDGQSVTVGGIITRLRSIVTKSGKKMAFVGFEDKTGEGEIIVFPNLYEKVGAVLEVDKVIKATGKVNSRDRDGTIVDEAKMIADEIDVITEQDLRDYESTGKTMAAPTTRAAYRPRKGAITSAAKSVSATITPPSAPAIAPPKTLYLRIQNPDDTDTLLRIKEACSKYPGASDVVLVIGEDKNALKMPFRVDAGDALSLQLTDIISSEDVVLK